MASLWRLKADQPSLKNIYDSFVKEGLQKMNVLVVGGAGYIGSHMVKYLGDTGYRVFVFDNLSTGFADAVVHGQLVQGDLANRELVEEVLRENKIETVFNFASSIQVSESIQDPAKYYRNNVINTINLLDAMRSTCITRLIFSSTAAVYGEPNTIPIPDAHPRMPINPYGRTKWMVEDVLRDYYHAYGIQSFSFRYFNAAGADPTGELGERHDPETHLIPLLLQVASGRRRSISVFGRDYETPDGTCIRDYVHVMDLAQAHERALQYLIANGGCHACNLGTGQGYSVQQLIEAVERVTGRSIRVEENPRRTGDPAQLVANASFAFERLGWSPRFSDLDTIISHAWAWEMKQV